MTKQMIIDMATAAHIEADDRLGKAIVAKLGVDNELLRVAFPAIGASHINLAAKIFRAGGWSNGQIAEAFYSAADRYAAKVEGA